MGNFMRVFVLITGVTYSAGIWANSGIPGPIILMGGSYTANFWRWVAVMMFMCIGIEAVICKYAKILKRPFFCSLIANIGSLIAGGPLIFLGAIDPTFFLLPTFVSILVEVAVIRYLPLSIGIITTNKKEFWRVYLWIIGANILTNLIMVGYLYWIYKFYNNDIAS